MHLEVTPLIDLHFEEQIYLVWKEIPGCARRLKVMASSANLIFVQCFGFSLPWVSSTALRSICSLTGSRTGTFRLRIKFGSLRVSALSCCLDSGMILTTAWQSSVV